MFLKIGSLRIGPAPHVPSIYNEVLCTALEEREDKKEEKASNN